MLRVSRWTEPALRSRVIAWTHTFQDVTESGTWNSMTAEPSAAVRSCGFQKAVSEKSLRRCGSGGAASALTVTAGDSAVTMAAAWGASMSPGMPPSTVAGARDSGATEDAAIFRMARPGPPIGHSSKKIGRSPWKASAARTAEENAYTRAQATGETFA